MTKVFKRAFSECEILIIASLKQDIDAGISRRSLRRQRDRGCFENRLRRYTVYTARAGR